MVNVIQSTDGVLEDKHLIIPDIYSDRFDILVSPLSITVVLGRTLAPSGGGALQNPPTEQMAILRFSPENWKTLLMAGRKQLKTREQANGQPFHLPADLLQSLGLMEADW